MIEAQRIDKEVRLKAIIAKKGKAKGIITTAVTAAAAGFALGAAAVGVGTLLFSEWRQ